MNKAIAIVVLFVSLTASLAGCASKTETPAITTSPAPAVTTTAGTTAAVPALTTATVAKTSAAPVTTKSAPITGTSTGSPADGGPTMILGASGALIPNTITVLKGGKLNFLNEDCCNGYTLHCDYPFNLELGPSATMSFVFTKTGKYNFWVDENTTFVGSVTVF
jgi:hypothetical protein